MVKKSIFTCFLLLALISTKAFGGGLLGEQYMAFRYQYGEFGDSHDRDTMDKTKGIALTYNHPVVENIDLGLSAELDWADGKDVVGGTGYDIDFKIGGVIGYATWIKPINPQTSFFISPQLGFQKASVKVKGADQNRKKDENDLFIGLDSGVEYIIDRVTITQALSISRADDTRISGKLGLGFNITERLMLTAGGQYQLNDDHDYMLTAGFVFRH